MPDFSKTLRSLFPTGQVFKFFKDTIFRKFIDSLAKMPDRIITHAELVRDSGIPVDIPSEALSDWENFLNLDYNTVLTDAQRSERISGKIATIGGQGPEYIQDVLQAAGFPVYVFESTNSTAQVYTSALNNFQLGELELGEFSGRIDPRSLNGILIYGAPIWETFKNYTAALGDFQLDDITLGEYNGTQTIQCEYVIPPTVSRFIFIWFLCGPNGINDFVNIPAEREVDFRKLVESIKPVHTWCLAQVHFV